MKRSFRLFLVGSFILLTNSCLANDADTQKATAEADLSKAIRLLQGAEGKADREKEIIMAHVNVNSEETLEQLLDELRTARKRKEVEAIRKIVMQMNCEKTERLLNRLNREKDAPYKAKLIRLLQDHKTRTVITALFGELGDDSPLRKPNPRMESFPQRVCDAAYNAIVSMLELKQFSRLVEWKTNVKQRNEAIANLREYWQKNQTSILEKIEPKAE